MNSYDTVVSLELTRDQAEYLADLLKEGIAMSIAGLSAESSRAEVLGAFRETANLAANYGDASEAAEVCEMHAEFDVPILEQLVSKLPEEELDDPNEDE